MNLPARFFILSVAAVVCFSSLVDAAPVQKEEYDQQNENFKQWWGTDLVWKFDDLPGKAMIEKRRLPYSGAIYPDKSGGTAQVLRKYDMAFNGRMLATSYERYDIKIHQEEKQWRGLFFRRTRRRTPDWAGHCNGWTAAAIRHAEPENNVVRNGVVFTPADIKGLLAEVYVYSDSVFLGGLDPAVNPATFHVVLSNWLGRGSHPIGMDSTLGKEVWNYPIYAYTTTSSKRGSRNVEVKMNIGYVDYVNQEYDRGPENFKFMFFHYMLDLDSQGNVAGGYYFGDSNRVDMLWAPLQPTQGGQTGNEEGNPHLNVKAVLALWRDSVSEEKRKNWFNIDPTKEDRQFNEREEEILALQAEEAKQAEAEAAAEAEVSDAEVTEATEELPVAANEEAAEEATEEVPAAAEEEAPAEEPVVESTLETAEASDEESETR